VKAIVCRELGPPESLVLDDVQPASLEPGQVRIRVAACGINFPDLLLIRGLYQEKPDLPFVPGGEVAGVVEEVADDVTWPVPGERVMAVTYRGGLAESVNAAVAEVYPMPDGMSFETAAAFPGVYGTSLHALRQRAVLRAGETLLVLGAAGGVGLAAVQIGKALGARVIAAAGGAEKTGFLRHTGADEVIDYATEDIRESVRRLTQGKGADVVFDPVGGDLFDEAIRCAGWNGRVLVVGFASGRIPRLPVNLALLKGIAVVGVYYGRFVKEEPGVAAANMRELAELYANARVRPHVHRTFPLAETAAAMQCLETRQVIGKVVVTLQPDQAAQTLRSRSRQ